MGSYTFSAPCAHWLSQHKPASFRPPVYPHFNMWPRRRSPRHTTFLHVQPGGPAGRRSVSAVSPPMHPRRLETDGIVIVSGSVSLFKRAGYTHTRISRHSAGLRGISNRTPALPAHCRRSTTTSSASRRRRPVSAPTCVARACLPTRHTPCGHGRFCRGRCATR